MRGAARHPIFAMYSARAGAMTRKPRPGVLIRPRFPTISKTLSFEQFVLYHAHCIYTLRPSEPSTPSLRESLIPPWIVWERRALILGHYASVDLRRGSRIGHDGRLRQLTCRPTQHHFSQRRLGLLDDRSE